jgi:hypothetical protein
MIVSMVLKGQKDASYMLLILPIMWSSAFLVERVHLYFVPVNKNVE